MRLIIALEQRFDRLPDGSVWAHSTCDYIFWQRYLNVFDNICVVARVRESSHRALGAVRSDGDKIEFLPLPYYIGPYQFIIKYFKIRSILKKGIAENDAILLRIPSQISNVLESLIRKSKRPYAVEVVGNPYDVFAPQGMKHLFRPFFRWWFTRRQTIQCKNACAAAYVTAKTLQQIYPHKNNAFTTHYSSIQLPDTAFVTTSRIYGANSKNLKIIFVGSLAQLYKAPDILIDAVALCIKRGFNYHLRIIGDGKYLQFLQNKINENNLGEHIVLVGPLASGIAIYNELDKSDLFVLPSRTEGLPRAMIEAMARGLPCIGTNAGGIPELLTPEFLVSPNNIDSLADKIIEISENPKLLNKAALDNLVRAKEYSLAKLVLKRNEFYSTILRKTDGWIMEKNNNIENSQSVKLYQSLLKKSSIIR